MTVKRLLSECDSAELSEWWRHFEEEPWPAIRGDAQAALAGEHITLAEFNDYLASYGAAADCDTREARETAAWKDFFAVLRARKRNS